MNRRLLGKPVKEHMLASLKTMVEALEIAPRLVIIQVGNNSASNTYVRNKLNASVLAGVQSELLHFEEDITEEALINEIEKLNNDNDVHGIIVQLPLPDTINEEKINSTISVKKDVDGFSSENLGHILLGDKSGLPCCTPFGIMEMLDAYDINLVGLDVVIIGRSNIVGKPLANMMINAGATVTVCNSRTKNIKEHTKRADLVVVATGQTKHFDSSYFRNGQVLVDVGIAIDENGKLCGDLHMESIDRDLVDMSISPSPNGCGQTTVSSLMRNVVKAALHMND